MKRLNRKKLRGGEGRGRPELEPEGRFLQIFWGSNYRCHILSVLVWGWRGCYGVYVSYVYIADSLTLQIPDWISTFLMRMCQTLNLLKHKWWLEDCSICYLITKLKRADHQRKPNLISSSTQFNLISNQYVSHLLWC